MSGSGATLEWARGVAPAREGSRGRRSDVRWTPFRPAVRVLVEEKGYTMAEACRMLGEREGLSVREVALLYVAVRNWRRKKDS